MVQRGLVLAGGGVAGIAWELGVLLGIRDAAADLYPRIVDADLIVGTSAGSTVAAQICGGTDLAELFARQLSPISTEIEVNFDAETWMASFAIATTTATSRPEMLRSIGAFALAAGTVTEPVRRAAVAGRLLHQNWPQRRLLIPAIDTATGELMVFDSRSGVALTDAVTASCAVPGIWPPVTINGRRYMDGGMRSGTNADLAIGCDRILVLTPSVEGFESPTNHLTQEIESLRPAEVFVIHADVTSIEAFGPNPLSPGTRAPAALAGRAVGTAVAARVGSFWGG